MFHRMSMVKQFLCQFAANTLNEVNVLSITINSSNRMHAKSNVMTMPIVEAITSAVCQDVQVFAHCQLTRENKQQHRHHNTVQKQERRNWKKLAKRNYDQLQEKAVLLLCDASLLASHHLQSHGNDVALR